MPINNAGQIAATAFDAQGHYHAVLLTPGQGPPPTPTVSIGDVTVFEGSSGTRNAGFLLTISPMTSSPVTVATAPPTATATAGSDYDAAVGHGDDSRRAGPPGRCMSRSEAIASGSPTRCST